MCDDQRIIRFYHSGWPGSEHNNRIFRNCDLFCNPDNYFTKKDFIIGDSAFSNMWFSITTFRKPPNGILNRHQERFNTLLSKPRVISEHTIDILKGRFPWLHHIHMKITKKKKACERFWLALMLVLFCTTYLHDEMSQSMMSGLRKRRTLLYLMLHSTVST